MEGRTSGSVTLIGPSWDTWHIDLIQQDDNLFFDKGWPVFLRDNFIECGDLLVFRYDGELHFTVQIFDQSGCEKEAAFNSKSTSTGQKREREEAVAHSDKALQSLLKKIRECSSSFESDCIDDNRDREADSCEETRRCLSLSTIFASPSQPKTCNIKPEDEEKKVAQSFISAFPYFVRKMKRFNVSGSYTLNIPYQFSMAHLPNCKTEVVLHNLKGASWTVNSVPTTKVHTSHTFCGGWLAFVRSNEIKLGDICIFELVHKCELHVYILRVGKQYPDSQRGTTVLTGSNVSSTTISCKQFDGVPKKVKKNSLKKIQLCNVKGSKSCEIKKHIGTDRNSVSIATCCLPKISHEKSEAAAQNRNNVEAKMGSPPGGNLRTMMALDEEKAARSFNSCVPHFVRIMRKFNISGSYTLKIPYKFAMAHLPDCKTEIVLRNLKGECWTVNSLPDSKGRMVHTFCGGWMAFVRGNDIKIGDVCIFELISKLEMRVHITGVGRKEVDLESGKLTSNESSAVDHPPF
ncbi:B3 domain-containing protein [Citrus sinensis]|nr:B3 domain-containing protein [Citrus sinensis]